jgi:serine/threonine protein kinase
MPRAVRYRVLRKIAHGGMAEIFLALQTGAEGFQKPVVLKRILPAFAADPHFVRMLVDEAHIASSLSHSHLVQVLDLGKAGGQFFLVLEFVDGWSLEQVRRRAQKARLKFPMPLTLHIVASLCRALSYVHRRTRDGRPLGIVHRDVSPQNVLLGREGEVKLADFGIAKAIGRREKSATGIIKGKFAYMSPEQSIGGALDARSDLFSVGTLLYILTTGRKPFDAPTDLEVLMQVRRARFEKPSAFLKEFNPEVERFIARALRADRSRRWQSAEQMADRLDAILVKLGQPSGPAALKRWLDALSARDGVKPPGDLREVAPEPGVGTIELETGDLEVHDSSSGEISIAPARAARAGEPAPSMRTSPGGESSSPSLSPSASMSSPSPSPSPSPSSSSSSRQSSPSYLSLSIATAEVGSPTAPGDERSPSPSPVRVPVIFPAPLHAPLESTTRRVPLFILGEPVTSPSELAIHDVPIHEGDPIAARPEELESTVAESTVAESTVGDVALDDAPPVESRLTMIAPSGLADPAVIVASDLVAEPLDVTPGRKRRRWGRWAVATLALLVAMTAGAYTLRDDLVPSMPPWAFARLRRPVDAWLRRLPSLLDFGDKTTRPAAPTSGAR